MMDTNSNNNIMDDRLKRSSDCLAETKVDSNENASSDVAVPPKRKCKIKASKNHKQLFFEKSKDVLGTGSSVISNAIGATDLPISLPDTHIDKSLTSDRKAPEPITQQSHSNADCGTKIKGTEETVACGVEKKSIPQSTEKKRCKIKCSKNYKQIIEEQSRKAANYAARKAREKAMEYASEHLPQPAAELLDKQLEKYTAKGLDKVMPKPVDEDIVMKKVKVKGEDGKEVVKVVKCRRKKRNKVAPASSGNVATKEVKKQRKETIQSKSSVAQPQRQTQSGSEKTGMESHAPVQATVQITNEKVTSTKEEKDKFDLAANNLKTLQPSCDAPVSKSLENNGAMKQVNIPKHTSKEDNTHVLPVSKEEKDHEVEQVSKNTSEEGNKDNRVHVSNEKIVKEKKDLSVVDIKDEMWQVSEDVSVKDNREKSFEIDKDKLLPVQKDTSPKNNKHVSDENGNEKLWQVPKDILMINKKDPSDDNRSENLWQGSNNTPVKEKKDIFVENNKDKLWQVSQNNSEEHYKDNMSPVETSETTNHSTDKYAKDTSVTKLDQSFKDIPKESKHKFSLKPLLVREAKDTSDEINEVPKENASEHIDPNVLDKTNGVNNDLALSNVHQNENNVHQNENKVHQNENRVHQNENNVHQNENNVHQNENSEHQNENKVYQNENKVHQNENKVHQNEHNVHQNDKCDMFICNVKDDEVPKKDQVEFSANDDLQSLNDEEDDVYDLDDDEFEIVEDDEDDKVTKKETKSVVKVKMPGMGGNGGGSSNVTDVINNMGKCTSLGGIARTVAPKLVNGVLGNSKVKKAFGGQDGQKSKCCSRCCNCNCDCEVVTKLIISVVSITVMSYDIAIKWTAFAVYLAYEGDSPITIVFGIICGIASLLLCFELRNVVMTCLVDVVKVKRVVSYHERQKAKKQVTDEEKWIEIISLLELLLADFPTILVLALTISYSSCDLYIATFKKSIMGQLALYAVCISALWKGLVAFVQFCLSKPFQRQQQGSRFYILWTLFRFLRPLVALALVFFAIYLIVSINGVSMGLMGKDETRPDCDTVES